MTPELTLGAGVDGSLGNSHNLFDNRCSCNYINTGGAFGHGDPTQIRLSYSSGPISFAVAIEDEGDSNFATAPAVYRHNNDFGVAGEVKWSGDSFGFDLNAGYYAKDNWTVNAGANFALADVANVGVAAGLFEEHGGVKGSKAGVFMGFTLSDALSAELGATYINVKSGTDSLTLAGGLYYTPVSQLTLGAEMSYTDFKGADNDVVGALVSKFSF
jgi:opacity protein-like surface antigen